MSAFVDPVVTCSLRVCSLNSLDRFGLSNEKSLRVLSFSRLPSPPNCNNIGKVISGSIEQDENKNPSIICSEHDEQGTRRCSLFGTKCWKIAANTSARAHFTPITAFNPAEDDTSATSIAAVSANHKPHISTLPTFTSMFGWAEDIAAGSLPVSSTSVPVVQSSLVFAGRHDNLQDLGPVP